MRVFDTTVGYPIQESPSEGASVTVLISDLRIARTPPPPYKSDMIPFVHERFDVIPGQT